ncbi:hypothetical protein K440DRAFT_641245 [Wilcoxina mikolae CBS 423.85]|nr:hypothetical protein K440DRAFT_641245 [Wilcoxina mikolae CBS 423.85]
MGYALCSGFGFILSAVCAWLHHTGGPSLVATRQRRYLRKVLKLYQSVARMFAISLQLVIVVFNVRRDLGGGTGGIGAQETEIGWNISLITMLALLYPLAVSSEFLERPGFNFSMLIASIVVVGRVVYLLVGPLDLAKPLSKAFNVRTSWLHRAWVIVRLVVCLVLFPVVTGTQFYAIIRIRNGQRTLARHIEAEFVDDEWGFGQMVAVVVWVLVLVDYAYEYFFVEESEE